MDTGIIKLIAFLMFFSGIFLLIYKILPRTMPGADMKNDDEFVIADESRFILMFKPFYQVLLPLIRKLPLGNYKSRMKKYIITAGMDEQVDSDDMIGFQISVMVLFIFMGAVLFDGTFVLFVFALIGVGYPYLWLYGKKKERQEKIRLSMPDVVDILSLSVEAGLAFNVAVQKVCEIYRKDTDPFVVELYLMDQNIKFGRSRNEALKIMAERVDLMELDSFTSTLIQAEKMGSSISTVLRYQAERMRSERFMKAERLGAQASQKLLVPMMVFIFPVIFIVIFGPYLIQLLMK
jgi:tight adherence protein C